MKLPRRRFLQMAAGAAALPAMSRVAGAQSYPTRPVRVINPFAPGGAADLIGRIVAQRLSEYLGHNFYIENIPAGATNVGTAIAAKSPADGYTLLFVTSSFVINTSF